MSSVPVHNERDDGALQRKTDRGAFVIGLAGAILVTGNCAVRCAEPWRRLHPAVRRGDGAGVMLCFCLMKQAVMMPDLGGPPSYAFETFKPVSRRTAKHVGALGAGPTGSARRPLAVRSGHLRGPGPAAERVRAAPDRRRVRQSSLTQTRLMHRSCAPSAGAHR